ncbi:MAG: dTDP-4-dehydrorhamnose reductase [Firmicutes bacterium]|nr:dTDP-4-dehydrorhamnose reductase [Bacillota bacterium]
MRILLTGTRGMLGSDLVEVLKKEHNLIKTNSNSFDVTNYKQCNEVVYNEKPDLIINPAAYTQVDKCEEEVELAYKVNALGPRNLAVICNQLNIPLLHISTDYVFDGTKETAYLEDDYKNPLGVYGKSKSLAEDYITALTNKYYIIRTSWLFGENGNNFIKTMLRLGKERDRLTVVNDQFGSPTYTKDLAKAISLLIKEPRYGIYHITNSEATSWYEFAKYIFNTVNYKVNVKPISTEEFKRPAPRPKYSVLDNRLLLLEGLPALRSYKEAVKDYLVNYI